MGALAVLVGGWARSSSGCAAERDPINQVQTGALPRTFFVGQMLEDNSDYSVFISGPPSSTLRPALDPRSSSPLTRSPPSASAGNSRTEAHRPSLLRADRQHADGTGTTGGARNDETRCRRRPRSPAPRPRTARSSRATPSRGTSTSAATTTRSTGEEQTSSSRTTTDRPWNEREYFRVDWSKNLVTDAYDFDTLSHAGHLRRRQVRAARLLRHRSRRARTRRTSTRTTATSTSPTRRFAEPRRSIHDLGWGGDSSPPAASPATSPAARSRRYCNPIEITLRQSFRKVVDNDYEPRRLRRLPLRGVRLLHRRSAWLRPRLRHLDDKWHRFAVALERLREVARRRRRRVRHRRARRRSAPIASSRRRRRRHRGRVRSRRPRLALRRVQATSARSRSAIAKVKHHPLVREPRLPRGALRGRDPRRSTPGATRSASRSLAGRLAECRRTQGAGLRVRRWAGPRAGRDDFVAAGRQRVAPPRSRTVFVLCHNPVDPAKDDPACGAQGLARASATSATTSSRTSSSARRRCRRGASWSTPRIRSPARRSPAASTSGARRSTAPPRSLVDLVELLNGELTSTGSIIDGKYVSRLGRRGPGPAPPRAAAPMSQAELTTRLAAFDPRRWPRSPSWRAKRAARRGRSARVTKARMHAPRRRRASSDPATPRSESRASSCAAPPRGEARDAPSRSAAPASTRKEPVSRPGRPSPHRSRA